VPKMHYFYLKNIVKIAKSLWIRLQLPIDLRSTGFDHSLWR